MKPVIIQHLIRQLKKTQPKKSVEDTPPPSSMISTVFVLVLAVVILVIALK